MADSFCFSCPETWKKPDKSIKLVVKKRLQKQGDKSSHVLKTRSLNASEVMRTQLKRHNPFSCSPRKKANISRPSRNQENIKLFKDLDGHQSAGHSEKLDEIQDISSACNNIEVEEEKAAASKEVKRNCSSGKRLPLDWSLKTRIRFTSPHPFTWCSKLLGNQEAEGICNFVRCRDTINSKDGLDSSVFQQNIMYWMHPVLPWLSLFPRLSSEIKLTSKTPSISGDDDIVEALQVNWSQSFRSLFNLVRCGHCDYFYLCSSQSTMLFRAANIGGLPLMSVLITPTTKGIRDTLDKEGIAYSLPALYQSKSSNSGDDDDDDDDVDDKEQTNPVSGDDDDETAGWLESMGVGAETLPQLKQSKINQQRIHLRNIDHQGSSVAVITGSHSQAFFNYLLNCKSLVAKTGNLAGIPPTLIAPVAFEGATLQSLSTKQGIIKQGKNLEQRYNVDISGPILPGIFSELCQVFETTQHQQFSAASKVLQASTPFNVMPSDVQHPAEDGEHVKFLEQCSNLCTTGLTQVKCEEGVYFWETS